VCSCHQVVHQSQSHTVFSNGGHVYIGDARRIPVYQRSLTHLTIQTHACCTFVASVCILASWHVHSLAHFVSTYHIYYRPKQTSRCSYRNRGARRWRGITGKERTLDERTLYNLYIMRDEIMRESIGESSPHFAWNVFVYM